MVDLHLFTERLAPVLGEAPHAAPKAAAWLAGLAPFVGLALWWGGRRLTKGAVTARLAIFLREGWRVDALYRRVAERPWMSLARHGSGEIADGVYDGIARLHRLSWRSLTQAHNGNLRRYAGGLLIGTVLLMYAAL
jgi:hypothetical protein